MLNAMCPCPQEAQMWGSRQVSRSVFHSTRAQAQRDVQGLWNCGRGGNGDLRVGRSGKKGGHFG